MARRKKSISSDTTHIMGSERSPMTYNNLTGYKSKPKPLAMRSQVPLSAGKGLVGSFKKGGKIKKTGLAKVHKGERVLNKKQTKKFDKAKAERRRKKHFGLK